MELRLHCRFHTYDERSVKDFEEITDNRESVENRESVGMNEDRRKQKEGWK